MITVLRAIFLLGSLMTTPVLAQTAPAIDRMSMAYGKCIGDLEQRLDAMASLQKQLEEAKLKIKELEEKKDK